MGVLGPLLGLAVLLALLGVCFAFVALERRL